MNQYFNNLLVKQDLSLAERGGLETLAQRIKSQFSVLGGNPQFYFAGSYGKKTMIRERYDLDIVVYWPHTIQDSIEDIYTAVGSVLRKRWTIKSKTVGWELPFQNGFHIDVIPGRALDPYNFEANLFRTDTKTWLKTSLKTHIDTVRNSGRTPAIRLLKLWKELHQVPFGKSFLLELMTIEGCKGKAADDLSGQLFGALNYIRNNILNCDFKDPANSNNSLCDDLTPNTRKIIKAAAEKALASKPFGNFFT